jgi:hypothetical protein
MSEVDKPVDLIALMTSVCIFKLDSETIKGAKAALVLARCSAVNNLAYVD